MQDRVSLYPGRVKLEPVAGQANLYDLTRADQPTQEGTPLNKANLLSDATAAAIKALLASQTENPVTPNAALAILAQAVDAAATKAAAVDSRGNCEVQHITYTGNGNTVLQFTFAHKPLMLTVFGDNVYFFAVQGAENATSRQGGSGAAVCSVTWEGKSVSWTYRDPLMMCNAANQTHQLIALMAADE